MKKRYCFLVFILCLGVCSFSQPVLTSANIGSFSVAGHNASTIGVWYGGQGHQNWNFSNIPTGPAVCKYITNIAIPSSAPLPGDTSFPTANYCEKISFPPFTSPSYFYKVVNDNSIETLGYHSVYYNSTIEYFVKPRFDLPYSYGDSNTAFSQTSPTSQTIGVSESYTAYGTLQTPFGTFTDVIRLNKNRATWGVDRNAYYDWYQLTPVYMPVMSMTQSWPSGYITEVIFYEDTTGLGVNQNDIGYKLNVNPNPVEDYLNILLPYNFNIDKVKITDLLGKTVYEESISNSTINVEYLNSGLYIVKVYSDDQTFETKFVKK